MNTTKKRRILSIAPVAIAVVLSVAACGAPCLAGSSGAPASNGTSNSGALSNTAASSNGSANSNGTAASGSSGTVGASGFGASGGSASGGSAAGGSAVGGQGGVSSGGSASAGSATPGQAGVSSGGFGNSNPSAGMTPDQVAAYCTGFPPDPTHVEGLVLQNNVDQYTALRKVTPVQLVPNVDVMLSDYQAILSEKRIYAQLKDELVANFKPLKDFNDQICVAH